MMAYIYALKTTLIKPNTNKQKQLLKLCLCARELKNIISFSLEEKIERARKNLCGRCRYRENAQLNAARVIKKRGIG